MIEMVAPSVGDNIDLVLYHPQLNLGPTLFPYSAPVGAPGTLQVGTDYSGHGNHLTLGATTGVSTDDPAYTGTAWSFDGGDFLLTPDLGNGDITAYTVFKVNETITGLYPGIWARNNVALDYAASSNGIDFVYRDSASNESKNIRISGLTRNKWYLAVSRASVSGLWGLSVTGVGTLTASEYTLKTDTTVCGNYLGRNSLFPFEGHIAYHAVYNWVHPDSLAMRCRNTIKSIMAPRGIAL